MVSSSLVTGQHYCFKGVRHDIIPAGIRATATSGLRLDAVVMDGVATVGRISEIAPQTDAGLGCYGQFTRYGLVERVFNGKPTRDAALNYLRGISLSTERTPRPLRDMNVESALTRMLAKVRNDSLRAVAVRDSIVRRDSLMRVADSLQAVARRDSIARRNWLKRLADSLANVAHRDRTTRRDSSRTDKA